MCHGRVLCVMEDMCQGCCELRELYVKSVVFMDVKGFQRGVKVEGRDGQVVVVG